MDVDRLQNRPSNRGIFNEPFVATATGLAQTGTDATTDAWRLLAAFTRLDGIHFHGH